ncbi:MFS transporter [Azospirillum sp. B21]|uniref:MFS transporter n=1 Tax=Azospirillum sp. B21 TaxID=2607496 RepID=UPI0011ED2F00|nr:MFS transporter [Azospirillum sp. B21]KAA0575185.1 MFS transporter [Azospirillum sp. B21]
MHQASVTVSDIIDNSRLSRYQLRIMLICALVAVLDGFDTQAVAFVAPILASSLNIPLPTFGSVFGVGLLGLAVGALVCGSIADRFGRRKVIIACTLIFGAFSTATAFSYGLPDLMVYRFLTGIGLGGVLPNIITLTSEYAPRRNRSMFVTIMFCGYPLGAMIGGIVSTWIIGAFGWKGVFLCGGLLPLALVPVLVVALPESVQFLAGKPGRSQEVAAIIRRIVPNFDRQLDLESVVSRGRLPPSDMAVRPLFADGRTGTTLLLWIAFFMNLLILYFLVNWLPSVLQRSGIPLDRAIVASVLLNFGGIVGGIVLGPLMDRFGPYRVLTTSYLGGALAVCALGGEHSMEQVFALVFVAGFCIMGSQFGANALASSLYPSSMLATGIGWALGIGRFGSIIGPVAGGLMLAVGWSMPVIFTASAAPGLLSAIAIIALGVRARRAKVPVTPMAFDQSVH